MEEGQATQVKRERHRLEEAIFGIDRLGIVFEIAAHSEWAIDDERLAKEVGFDTGVEEKCTSAGVLIFSPGEGAEIGKTL